MQTRLIPDNFHPQTYTTPSRMSGDGLSRLLAAAVVNQSFRDLLLQQPAQALKKGFQGEHFSLSHQEKDLVLSISAQNLADFAVQLIQKQKGADTYGSGCWIPDGQAAVVLEAG